MFLKKRGMIYSDAIDSVQMQKMYKPKPTKKIQDLLDTIKLEVVKPKETYKFTQLSTDEQWSEFHRINEQNMKKAYDSKEGYYKDGSKLYIAGTRDTGDVMDWAKIPLGTFNILKFKKM